MISGWGDMVVVVAVVGVVGGIGVVVVVVMQTQYHSLQLKDTPSSADPQVSPRRFGKCKGYCPKYRTRDAFWHKYAFIPAPHP